MFRKLETRKSVTNAQFFLFISHNSAEVYSKIILHPWNITYKSLFFSFFFRKIQIFFEEHKDQIKKMQEVSELSRQSSTTSMGSLSEEV